MQFLLRFVLWVPYGVLKLDHVQIPEINISIIAKFTYKGKTKCHTDPYKSAGIVNVYIM